jgi:hypothetical protein
MDAKNYHKVGRDNLCWMFTREKVLKSISNLNFIKATNLINASGSRNSKTSRDMFRFLNTMRMRVDLFKTISIIYQKLHIGYYVLS